MRRRKSVTASESLNVVSVGFAMRSSTFHAVLALRHEGLARRTITHRQEGVRHDQSIEPFGLCGQQTQTNEIAPVLAHERDTSLPSATVLVRHRRVLDDGRIVESGTHDELMANDCAYARQVRAGGSFAATS